LNTINPNLYPRDGFFYKESDGTKIVGQNWHGVIIRVRNYRRRAGLSPGNPEQDVIDQACARNPVLCRNDNGVRLEQTKKASLKSRTLKWFLDLRARIQNSPLDFSDEGTVRARADICARCPLNQEIGSGCSTCKEALAENRKEILGRKTRDGRLHSCMVLGEDNQVSVWIEQQTVENGELPGHCWRKRG